MIVRLGAFFLLLYILGFLLFAVTLAGPAGARKTDAAVVLTGGSGRIEYAADILAQGHARRLLIAGTDPAVTKADLVEGVGLEARLIGCCVDLGSDSVDTRSNAEEAKRWLDKRGYKSLRLITNDWHMLRARYEFGRVLGDDYEIVTDATPSQPSFAILFGEYNKYLLRRVAVFFEI